MQYGFVHGCQITYGPQKSSLGDKCRAVGIKSAKLHPVGGFNFSKSAIQKCFEIKKKSSGSN